jgi:hypothetical protein
MNEHGGKDCIIQRHDSSASSFPIAPPLQKQSMNHSAVIETDQGKKRKAEYGYETIFIPNYSDNSMVVHISDGGSIASEAFNDCPYCKTFDRDGLPAGAFIQRTKGIPDINEKWPFRTILQVDNDAPALRALTVHHHYTNFDDWVGHQVFNDVFLYDHQHLQEIRVSACRLVDVSHMNRCPQLRLLDIDVRAQRSPTKSTKSMIRIGSCSQATIRALSAADRRYDSIILDQHGDNREEYFEMRGMKAVKVVIPYNHRMGDFLRMFPPDHGCDIQKVVLNFDMSQVDDDEWKKGGEFPAVRFPTVSRVKAADCYAPLEFLRLFPNMEHYDNTSSFSKSNMEVFGRLAESGMTQIQTVRLNSIRGYNYERDPLQGFPQLNCIIVRQPFEEGDEQAVYKLLRGTSLKGLDIVHYVKNRLTQEVNSTFYYESTNYFKMLETLGRIQYST